ncbi:MAG TPA: outer membrane protein assembly factor BamC, partial [Ramlibacter sp.]|nr:outer membrane protein assembly factor BamC [Ramlibacter sp.]
MKQSAKLGLLALAALLSACSVLEGDRIDYKSAGKGPSLEVPPDLTQLSRDSRYMVPGSGPVSASAYQAGQTVAGVPTAAIAVGDVRIERAGNQRWLVVNRPADQLWGPVRDFWQENGFLLAMDQANLGIMETDWAENRAKIPQDF